MIFWANGIWKQVGADILISDKADFKPKLVRRDKEGHHILIKEQSIKKIKQLQIYIHWTLVHAIAEILLDIKGQVRLNTIIVGGLSSPFLSVYRSSRPKNQQETS
jgi:hypothetical protein